MVPLVGMVLTSISLRSISVRMLVAVRPRMLLVRRCEADGDCSGLLSPFAGVSFGKW